MRRILIALALLAVLGLGLFWAATRPRPIDPDLIAGLVPDVAHGEQVFWAAGCAGCHADVDAKGGEKLILRGGQRFPSPFGTFLAPNISNDQTAGIGAWSALDLANAMLRGVSPEGAHYYPVFPYGTYSRARPQDIVDLRAFLATLPSDPTPSQPHEVGFPFNIRLGLGLWKLLYLRDGWVVSGDLTAKEDQGRYLVEALGHCGECHTPRDALGGPDLTRWLAGGPVPGGTGRFPNITPGKLDWSEADIAEYLKSGFTPDYDSAGGHMALVVENTGKLSDDDREAMAAYLKKVAPQP